MIDPTSAFLDLLADGHSSDTAGRIAFQGQRHLRHQPRPECVLCDEPATQECFVEGHGHSPVCEQHFEQEQD